MMKAGLGAGNGGRTGSKGVCVGGGDDAKERWDDVVWELIIKLERTKEREMSSYRRDEVWKEEWSRDLTEEDTGGMEGRSRRKGSEQEDKKTVNEVYEYTTCYWLRLSSLIAYSQWLHCDWLCWMRITLRVFFFFFPKGEPPTVTGREKHTILFVISIPAIAQSKSRAINPPMANGHAIHVQHSSCKYIELAIYLFVFSQTSFTLFISSMHVAAGTLRFPRSGILNKFIHSFIYSSRKEEKERASRLQACAKAKCSTIRRRTASALWLNTLEVCQERVCVGEVAFITCDSWQKWWCGGACREPAFACVFLFLC